MELILSESRKWATPIKQWLYSMYRHMIEARQAEADRRIAFMQLNSMSDRELHDIGISRGDIRRIVNEK